MTTTNGGTTQKDAARDPLSRDVDLLGRSLGAVLIEQMGTVFFNLEEEVRELTKRIRGGDTAAIARLDELVEALTVDEAEGLIRAFTHYFHLTNLAEERHRVRWRDTRSKPSDPRKQSVHDAIQSLKNSGLSLAQVLELLASLELGLTFTAHPTELRRRTVRAHLEAISEQLPRMESETERAAALEIITARVEVLWGTLELQARNPTVRDEVHNGLHYLESIARALPELESELHHALLTEFGAMAAGARLPLAFYSWIGGDRDGNPFVTPEVTKETLEYHALTARQSLRSAVKDLYAVLSEHLERVDTDLGDAPEPFRFELEALYRALETEDVDAVAVLERVKTALLESGQSRAARTFLEPVLSRARAFNAQPTSGEPVKDSSFSRSSVVNRSAPSRVAGRIEKAPLGRSVSASTSPMIKAPKGVREAGFITNGQPTASAGAILWAARLSGKLNGEMKEQGPIGTRFHMP